ncbi:MAG TPA: type 4a pilus biogenesis protein PilO [Steroidobacteraceae bacterium]|nr:type 4a pilus biogenesis protein PilO [Steroidobacteraceae bacterium]
MSLVQTPAAPVKIASQAPGSRAPAVARRSDGLVPLRRFGMRVANEWLPRATWTVARTGRPGLVGLALLVASAVFFASTQVPVENEIAALRGQLASARLHQATAPRAEASDVAKALRNLPKRADMPAILGVLLQQADDARLTLDTGKYETSSSKSGDIVRYKVAFPVTGPYPQVRKFIDATLTALPAAAISDLSIERKNIADGTVEAQIRLTVFTRSAP